MTSWYKTGAAADEAMEQDEKRRAEASNRVFRWFISKDNIGTEYRITILDDLKHPAGYDSPFVFQEHAIWSAGPQKSRSPMYFTCIEGLESPETGKKQSCPLCEMKDEYPYLASAYTIVTHDEFSSSKKGGQIYKHEIRLLVAKPLVAKTLRKYLEKRRGLRGCVYDISRIGDSSASTGNNLDFIDKVNDEGFEKLTEGKFKVLPPPYDYHEILAPKSEQEIRDILSGKASYSSNETDTANVDYDGGPVDDGFVKF